MFHFGCGNPQGRAALAAGRFGRNSTGGPRPPHPGNWGMTALRSAIPRRRRAGCFGERLGFAGRVGRRARLALRARRLPRAAATTRPGAPTHRSVAGAWPRPGRSHRKAGLGPAATAQAVYKSGRPATPIAGLQQPQQGKSREQGPCATRRCRQKRADGAKQQNSAPGRLCGIRTTTKVDFRLKVTKYCLPFTTAVRNSPANRGTSSRIPNLHRRVRRDGEDSEAVNSHRR